MELLEKHFLKLAWIIAIIATLGSLYFSEIRNFPPCVLCWYQRICMYPQVLLLGIAVGRKDKEIIYYSLPLAVIGLIISTYHNLLYFNLIPHAAESCQFGVSCTTKFIEWFGFLTIPLLSFIGFALIISFLLVGRKQLVEQD